MQLSDTFAEIDEHLESLPDRPGPREIVVESNARGVLGAHAGATFIRYACPNQPTGARHAGTRGQAIEEVVHERQEYFDIDGLFDDLDRHEMPGLAHSAAQVDRSVRPAADWSHHAVWLILDEDACRRRIRFETDP